jgi:hypothetical protein
MAGGAGVGYGTGRCRPDSGASQQVHQRVRLELVDRALITLPLGGARDRGDPLDDRDHAVRRQVQTMYVRGAVRVRPGLDPPLPLPLPAAALGSLRVVAGDLPPQPVPDLPRASRISASLTRSII